MPKLNDAQKVETIARLNDHLRKTGTGGSIMITQNLRRVTGFDAAVLATTLANYDGFDAEMTRMVNETSEI